MLRAGLELEPASLSLAAGSHSGEPMHVDGVRAMLASGGLTENDLRCPEDYPLSEAARVDLIKAGIEKARVYMNCSGKHAAMLRAAQAGGWPLDDYRAPEHPLQQVCRATIEELAGETITAVGVDGCGAALFALSLTGLARGFLRVVSATDGPERAVAEAMRAFPEMMSGTGRDDARLMRGIAGLLAKGGAEGVHAAAIAGVGAVAVKIDDGALRAHDVAMAAALRRLGVEAPIVKELAEPVILGGGRPVGAVRATNLF
jgi:L-asparaginase II